MRSMVLRTRLHLAVDKTARPILSLAAITGQTGCFRGLDYAYMHSRGIPFPGSKQWIEQISDAEAACATHGVRAHHIPTLSTDGRIR